MWQTLKLDPRGRKRWLELEFWLLAIMKLAVSRRLLLVFYERPMRLATNFTLVSAGYSGKIEFFWKRKNFLVQLLQSLLLLLCVQKGGDLKTYT
jgi:hypothetical protein